MQHICAFFFLLFLYFPSVSQLQKNVELEVLGRPTWDMEIALGEKGLLLLVKSDVTKISIFRLDAELNQVWSQEYFLDAERAPKAYTIANDHISLLFSETRGMYYQIFEIDLATGLLEQSGYEIREYFDDQDYVFLGEKIIMAGKVQESAALFTYNMVEFSGKLEPKDIKGEVEVNLFEYVAENKQIESLWSVKEKAFTDEKKKKGEYTKDAYLVYAVFDTSGTLLNQTRISQRGGKFPMQGKLIRLPNGDRFIYGSYQTSEGDKGIFTSNLSQNNFNTFSYSQILKGGSGLSLEDMQLLYTQYNLLLVQPIIGANGEVIVGGSFFAPQYKNVSEQDPNWNNNGMWNRNPYDPLSRNWNRASSRTRTRQVFLGFSYPTSFTAQFGENGELLSQTRIDLNHTSSQIHQPLAFNRNGSVSYCVQGDVAANNFNISSKPILYKLNDERGVNRQSNFIPKYESVNYWYDKYFFAVGTKSKTEAISINDNLAEGTQSKKRKKRRTTPATMAQIRKTYYITKIASGS